MTSRSAPIVHSLCIFGVRLMILKNELKRFVSATNISSSGFHSSSLHVHHQVSCPGLDS